MSSRSMFGKNVRVRLSNRRSTGLPFNVHITYQLDSPGGHDQYQQIQPQKWAGKTKRGCKASPMATPLHPVSKSGTY